MGLALAPYVLLLWIPFAFWAFKRFTPARAALYVFLGGICFLPEVVNIKIPFVPELDKQRMTAVALMLAILIKKPRGLNRRVDRWWYIAAGTVFFGGLITGMTNQDPLFYGILTIPGHTFKDSAYVAIVALLIGAPASYAGMRCFRDERDLKDLVSVLAAFGLVYTVGVLIEVRMSPQMHQWVYGFTAPGDFGMAIRWGGYRPCIFMGHGLSVSLFLLAPTITTTAWIRAGGRIWNFTARQAGWILTVAIVLCKSTGVWFYALYAVPLARYATPKVITRVAIVMIALACLYPYLRATQLFPVDKVLEYAGNVQEDRKQSLEFRFKNEEILLEKAMHRPWFGWGGYGRNRVFDDRGVDISVTDGAWALMLGSGGYVGFSAQYAFVVIPVLLASLRLRRIRDAGNRALIAALVLVVAILWFDNLPNAPPYSLAQFLGGALCSITATLSRQQARAPASVPQRAKRARTPEEPVAARAT